MSLNRREMLRLGAAGAAWTGASGSAGTGGRAKVEAGNGLDIAADDSSKPPAPAAPKRNISRRFNDILSPPE